MSYNNNQNTSIYIDNSKRDNEEFNNNQYNQKDWTDTIRLGFIRKVYGILSFQLLITVSLTIISFLVPSFSKFQQNNSFLLYLCLFGTILTSILLLCFRSISRTVPWNYILLLIFTLCESYMISFICSVSNPNLVLMAATMTLGVVIAISIYSVYTKTDFTLFGSLFFILSAVMLLFGLFLWFSQNPVLHIIYSSIGVILFGLYLVYDTQLIVGKHSLKLDYDDYILGSMMLYTDIIQMFLHILRLLNSSQRV